MNPTHMLFTHRNTISPPTSLPKQRGMATLLIVLLVGVGLVSISAGAMHAIRSTQERQNAAHAQVNAQSGAWAAAEAVRQYLLTLDAAGIDALKAQIPLSWTLSGYSGFSPKVSFIEITGPHAPKNSLHVKAHITAIDDVAKASSVLELVYEISPAMASVTTIEDDTIIQFKGDFVIANGTIEIIKEVGDTTPYEISVDGNIKTSTTIKGIDTLRSTKSVNITGGKSFYREVHANCDVQVSGASLPKTIKTTRNICLSDTNRDDYPIGENLNSIDMQANGSVYLNDGAGAKATPPYGHNNVIALADKDESLGGASYCAADAVSVCDTLVKPALIDGNVVAGIAKNGGVYTTNAGVKINTIRTGGDVYLGGSAVIGQLHAKHNFYLYGNTNQISEYAKYAGDLFVETKPNEYNYTFGVTNPKDKDIRDPNYSFTLTPVSKVPTTTQTFDINDVKLYANYIFSYDTTTSTRRVVVRHVSIALDYEGPAGGDNKGYYILGADWLCKTATATTPTTNVGTANCPTRIGRGYGGGSGSINHYKNGAVNEWTLTGDQAELSMAPGIAFFEGNLNVSQGTYVNTFLASGNITSINGGAKIYALNYAGYDGTQEGKTYSAYGACAKTGIFTLKPAQFCKPDGTFDFLAEQGTGNYGLMAGNDINISTGEVFGAIKAGNTFKTSASITMHGYVAAVGQGDISKGHGFANTTIIDLTNLPPGYKPSGGSTTSSTTIPSTTGSTKILWSRYL